MANNSRMVRTGAKPETYAQPSFNCASMESGRAFTPDVKRIATETQ